MKFVNCIICVLSFNDYKQINWNMCDEKVKKAENISIFHSMYDAFTLLITSLFHTRVKK